MNLVGQQVGSYRILALIGRGGTAEVYKAHHAALDRQVAIKLLLREASQDHDWVRRFRQEALLLGKLDHPHILPIYDAGEHEGRPYLVMKYVGGGVTLRSQLDGHAWPLNRVVKVIEQIADALHAAHEAGIVHRDVKPSNILVTTDLRCLVFDFGIAKPFHRHKTATGEGLIVGTPEFMAPEQCKGERVDHRVDIYALGIMTYQMLTGRVPFTAETPVGILMKHLTEPLPIPPRHVDLSPAVNVVLSRALARLPEDRFANMKEFSQALRDSVDERPTVTLRAPSPFALLPHGKKWVSEHWHGLAAVRALLIGTLALAALAGLLLGDRVESPPAQSLVLYGPPIPTEYLMAPIGSLQDTAIADPGRERPVRTVRLEPGSLRIDADRSAAVWLDGQRVGTAPGLLKALPPGRHRLQVVADTGRVHEDDILITSGSVTHVRAAFEDPPRGQATREAGLLTEPAPTGPSPPLAKVPAVRRWSGYLTDSECLDRGGQEGPDHLRCAERCIRLGREPMLYSEGKLYRIEGFERLTVRRGLLSFLAWLDQDTGTLYVTGS